MTVPTGICSWVGGLGVAQAGDVDGGDRPRAAPAGSARIAAIISRRVEDLDRLAAGGRDEAGVLGLQRGEHRAAVTRAQRGDVRVAQRLMQVRAGAGGADRARAGEHLQQRVLDQILGVLTGAGHAAGGAAQGVDVDRKRLGEEFGACDRDSRFAPFPIWGNSPESTLNFEGLTPSDDGPIEGATRSGEGWSWSWNAPAHPGTASDERLVALAAGRRAAFAAIVARYRAPLQRYCRRFPAPRRRTTPSSRPSSTPTRR